MAVLLGSGIHVSSTPSNFLFSLSSLLDGRDLGQLPVYPMEFEDVLRIRQTLRKYLGQ